jgi:hypothetical protein
VERPWPQDGDNGKEVRACVGVGKTSSHIYRLLSSLRTGWSATGETTTWLNSIAETSATSMFELELELRNTTIFCEVIVWE